MKVIINEQQLEMCIILESGYANGGRIYAHSGTVKYPYHGGHEITYNPHMTWQPSPKFGSGKGPRGYRNNNPLNIRKSNSKWHGLVYPNTDGSFEQFQSMAYGFRAGIKLLTNYIKKGYNTINKIIYRWAPPSDNNKSSSYVNSVVKMTGIKPETIISQGDRASITKIVKAMAYFENGSMLPNIDNEIEKGWDLL